MIPVAAMACVSLLAGCGTQDATTPSRAVSAVPATTTTAAPEPLGIVGGLPSPNDPEANGFKGPKADQRPPIPRLNQFGTIRRAGLLAVWSVPESPLKFWAKASDPPEHPTPLMFESKTPAGQPIRCTTSNGSLTVGAISGSAEGGSMGERSHTPGKPYLQTIATGSGQIVITCVAT
ncbi:MAG: hypothetical protein JWN01_68 [Patescibacteria group bacterium]|nr:hypothetical protein [Patescibacteria group bacterium]